MNKKKPRLHNKEITAYYIHWASKFATMIIKHKQTADYIHWASNIATSSRKVSPAGELQRKQLSKMMRLCLFNTYIFLTLKDKQADR